jgi:hypothetical protein
MYCSYGITGIVHAAAGLLAAVEHYIQLNLVILGIFLALVWASMSQAKKKSYDGR